VQISCLYTAAVSARSADTAAEYKQDICTTMRSYKIGWVAIKGKIAVLYISGINQSGLLNEDEIYKTGSVAVLNLLPIIKQSKL
jgi:hypothetical protein